MNCSIQGCPGRYKSKPVIHAVKRGEDVLVFENVPAEVCDVCSDTLFAPDTIRHLEELMRQHVTPRKQAPVFDYR